MNRRPPPSRDEHREARGYENRPIILGYRGGGVPKRRFIGGFCCGNQASAGNNYMRSYSPGPPSARRYMDPRSGPVVTNFPESAPILSRGGGRYRRGRGESPVMHHKLSNSVSIRGSQSRQFGGGERRLWRDHNSQRYRMSNDDGNKEKVSGRASYVDADSNCSEDDPIQKTIELNNEENCA